MTAMQIYAEIRAAMEADPRSQREIADAAGVHQVNLSKFKAGQKDLSLDSVCRLAAALGLVLTVQKAKRKS